MNRNQLYRSFTLVLLLLFSCSDKGNEVTIFSIPNDATPSELEAQGFRVSRKLNHHNDKDKDGTFFGELDMRYANVIIQYHPNDTTEIDSYTIHIDYKPFEKMTGYKAGAYKSLEIDGFNYKVDILDGEIPTLQLKRLKK